MADTHPLPSQMQVVETLPLPRDLLGPFPLLISDVGFQSPHSIEVPPFTSVSFLYFWTQGSRSPIPSSFLGPRSPRSQVLPPLG